MLHSLCVKEAPGNKMSFWVLQKGHAGQAVTVAILGATFLHDLRMLKLGLFGCCSELMYDWLPAGR